ncbi:MAG: hypothetical protein PHY16_01025 [Methylobacter sp.]|nr:hypothetical protein [Methylobacter sp.]
MTILRVLKRRHPGMHCRGPGYTDVNSAIILGESHILVLWMHAGLSCPAPQWGKCQSAPGGLVRQSMPV